MLDIVIPPSALVGYTLAASGSNADFLRCASACRGAAEPAEAGCCGKAFQPVTITYTYDQMLSGDPVSFDTSSYSMYTLCCAQRGGLMGSFQCGRSGSAFARMCCVRRSRKPTWTSKVAGVHSSANGSIISLDWASLQSLGSAILATKSYVVASQGAAAGDGADGTSGASSGGIGFLPLPLLQRAQ